MWLMTKYGFFSIVQKKSRKYHIRSRSKQDLLNLQQCLEGQIGYVMDIIKTPEADYPYRMVVGIRELIAAMHVLAVNLHYENFKGHIYCLPDQQDKGRVYHQIWVMLREWQAHRELKEKGL